MADLRDLEIFHLNTLLTLTNMTIYYSFHEGGRFFKMETDVSRKELMREICTNWVGNYSQVLGVKIHACLIPHFNESIRFDGYNGFTNDSGGIWTNPEGVVHNLIATYETLSKQDIPVFDPNIYDSKETFND